MMKNYLEVDVFNINQFQSDTVLIGKLKFSELMIIHRLTERKESLYDPFGEEKLDLSKEDEEFQRQLSQNKLMSIARYLELEFDSLKSGKATGLFPTSIIVSLDADYDYEPGQINEKYLNSIYSEDLYSCFINSDKSKLFIPKNKRITLIVDGQHRFYGVKRFYDSLKDTEDKRKIDEFEFVTTFLIGFDIYEVGKVFATVNFTQKPVNRSLYYDIFGSVPDQKSDIKLAHDLALHLNNNEKSPIKDMIKMLGKGYGLFSQSFFVEKILIHFKEKGVWEKIYGGYISGKDEEYKKLPLFMRVYLNCIKEAYPSAWPKRTSREGISVYSPYDYKLILCKTTGMGAMLRLIRDIYPLAKNLDENQMSKTISAILKRIPDKEAGNLFSREGEYGISAGEGLQQKLYRVIKSKLELS